MSADASTARRSPPVVVVPEGGPYLETTRALAEAAGRRVAKGWTLPPAPWDLAPHGVVVSGSLAGTGREACLVDAVVRGAGAIVALPTESPPTRLVDALQRITPVVDGRHCKTLELDPVQVEVLVALSRGANTSDAARDAYLSVRTAHRRIAEARAILGASSTNAAIALITDALRFWAS